jgi:hypothetical protein
MEVHLLFRKASLLTRVVRSSASVLVLTVLVASWLAPVCQAHCGEMTLSSSDAPSVTSRASSSAVLSVQDGQQRESSEHDACGFEADLQKVYSARATPKNYSTAPLMVAHVSLDIASPVAASPAALILSLDGLVKLPLFALRV